MPFLPQYNADIPFNKQPVPGFYDVDEENAKHYSAPVGQSLRQLEGKRRQDLDDAEEKRKRQKKDGDKGSQNTQFIAAREAQIAKLKETEQIIKRRKLNLPTPQVGEAELEDIVKIGRSSRTALDLVGSSEASDKLIGEYDGLNKARMARTPMAAPQGEWRRSRESYTPSNAEHPLHCLRGPPHGRGTQPAQHDGAADATPG